MESYFKNLKEIWIANIVTAILCYGYELTNCSIGIDDESIERALNGRLFETGRFGVNLIHHVIDIGNYLPWIYLLICLSLIVLANVLLTGFWRSHIKSYDYRIGILYSIVMLSYPGFAYKFIFTVNLVQMGLVYLTVVILVCLNYYNFLIEFKKRYICLSIALYYFLFINYETAIVFVVILFVYSLVLGHSKYGIKEWVKKGAGFLSVIISSMILWKIIEKIIFLVTGTIPDKYAAAYIRYSKGSVLQQIINMVHDFFAYLKMENIRLIPYIILFAAVIIYIWKNSNPWIIKVIWVITEVIAFSFMQIITGTFYQLPRVSLYLSVFWAVAVCSLYLLIKNKNQIIQYVFYIFILLLVLNNSIAINKVVYCDNVKNELDVQVAQNIYKDIQKIDNYSELPVVFIGALDEYQLPYDVSLGIDSMFRHDIVSNNCLSNETPDFRIYSFFKILGMPVKTADDMLYMKVLEKSAEYSVYPKDGYIGVDDNIIIVKLGECNEVNSVDISQMQIQSGKTRSYLDNYSDGKDTLTIQGWGYISGITSNRVKKYILLTGQNSGNSFLIRCANVERQDVVDAMKIKNSYKWCGYNLQFNKNLLEPDTYDVQILFEAGGVFYNSDIELNKMTIE